MEGRKCIRTASDSCRVSAQDARRRLSDASRGDASSGDASSGNVGRAGKKVAATGKRKPLDQRPTSDVAKYQHSQRPVAGIAEPCHVFADEFPASAAPRNTMRRGTSGAERITKLHTNQSFPPRCAKLPFFKQLHVPPQRPSPAREGFSLAQLLQYPSYRHSYVKSQKQTLPWTRAQSSVDRPEKPSLRRCSCCTPHTLSAWQSTACISLP